jgi:hypothetical protein
MNSAAIPRVTTRLFNAVSTVIPSERIKGRDGNSVKVTAIHYASFPFLITVVEHGNSLQVSLHASR